MMQIPIKMSISKVKIGGNPHKLCERTSVCCVFSCSCRFTKTCQLPPCVSPTILRAVLDDPKIPGIGLFLIRNCLT